MATLAIAAEIGEANVAPHPRGKKLLSRFLCPLLEKYGAFIARCNALIEKVSP
eukprot:SAG31_NODE_26720_length_437_cov_1.529586_1_plen_52_part_10